MRELESISVVGLGRLGAPIAACLAARGFRVVGYDSEPERIAALEAHRSLGLEPGFERMCEEAGDRLRATSDLARAIASSDLTLLAVPTPVGPDGSFSLEFVLPVVREIGGLIRLKESRHTLAVLSTVMPGSTERRILPALEEASGKVVGSDVGLCAGGLFVAIGSVVEDFLAPDLVLVGESDRRTGDLVERMVKCVCQNDPPVVRMSPFNAELTKLAMNVFVATKITFANLLARLCEQMPGGNVDVVTAAMQLDHRVGKGALCGAVAYGGPFLGRDTAAFGTLLRRLDLAPELLGAMGHFNRGQIPWLADFVHERLEPGACVGVLGLSYKPETDVVVESPGLLLCRELVDRGLCVVAHDPAAASAARSLLPPAVSLAESPEAAIGPSDIVVVVTPWREYWHLPLEAWTRAGRPRTVVDCWRIVPDLADTEGVRYVSLGTGPGTPPSALGQTSHPPGPGRTVCP